MLLFLHQKFNGVILSLWILINIHYFFIVWFCCTQNHKHAFKSKNILLMGRFVFSRTVGFFLDKATPERKRQLLLLFQKRTGKKWTKFSERNKNSRNILVLMFFLFLRALAGVVLIKEGEKSIHLCKISLLNECNGGHILLPSVDDALYAVVYTTKA